MSRTCILILSCDKYYELWDFVTFSYSKYWPECSMNKFILTNYKKYNTNDFTSIEVGSDISWSSNLLIALKILQNDYDRVLLSFDDLLLKFEINNNDFVKFHDLFIQYNMDCLKFIKHHGFNRSKFGEVSLIDQNVLYRTTCVFSLWKINVLEKILDKKENAWEFEKNGTKRSGLFYRFYTVNRSFFLYDNVVIAGKVHRKFVRDVNFSSFEYLEMMSLPIYLKFLLKLIFFSIFVNTLPYRLQLILLRIIKKLNG